MLLEQEWMELIVLSKSTHLISEHRVGKLFSNRTCVEDYRFFFSKPPTVSTECDPYSSFVLRAQGQNAPSATFFLTILWWPTHIFYYYG